jgi:hypothetical protein
LSAYLPAGIRSSCHALVLPDACVLVRTH